MYVYYFWIMYELIVFTFELSLIFLFLVSYDGSFYLVYQTQDVNKDGITVIAMSVKTAC
jgi:hypothetical protein